MYILLTIFKALVLLTGLTFTVINFIPGISGDKVKLKKAGIMFFFTFLIFVIITIIEFTIAFSKK
jgi:hypothetical protein